MGLIAMVTGHVPQHLPFPPPLLPSHSHQSSEGRRLWFPFCPSPPLSASRRRVDGEPLAAQLAVRGKNLAPFHQQSLCFCLMLPLISHLLSALTSLPFSPSLGTKKKTQQQQQQQKKARRRHREGGEWVEANRSRAPVADFPAETVNDHSVVC